MPKEYGIGNIGAEALGVKRRKPVAVLLSSFLVLTLLLGGCGDGGGDGGGEGAGGEGAANVTPTVQAAEAPAVGETAEATEVTETVTNDTEDDEAEEVAVITDTELLTQTQVTTDVTVTTDTVVIEQNEVTTVITDTDVVTNVVESSDSSTTSETDVVSETEDIAPEVEVSGTGETTQAGQSIQVQPGAAATGAFTGIEGSTGRSILATSLLDSNFTTSDGEVGGEIQDVVVNIQNGQVLYVLLEYGGVLDVGDTDMPVPLSAFSWGGEDQLTLNIDGETLANFPGVGNDWPVSDDTNWDVDVRNFWQGINVDTGFDAEQSMQGVRRVSTLLSSPIVGGETGDRTVQDIIISLGEGRASYVLIDADEGVGESLHAVPFTTFDATAPEAGFTWSPDFDPTMLEGAPQIDRATFAENRVYDETYDDEWENFWGGLGFPVNRNND